MSSSEVVLKAVNLTKIYGKNPNTVQALKGVNMELRRGEILVIMGASGSGKSTLLNALGLLEVPTAGEIYIEGIKINKHKKEPQLTRIRRERIGFVFQSYNLISSLTAEENVAIPLILAGKKNKEVKDSTATVLKAVGLYEQRNQRPAELSGGQQQRTALARAIITKPTILLADEPTGNLDRNTSKEMIEIILQMREEYNQSIILVTHDEKIAKYGDRILTIEDGEIKTSIDNKVVGNQCTII